MLARMWRNTIPHTVPVPFWKTMPCFLTKPSACLLHDPAIAL